MVKKFLDHDTLVGSKQDRSGAGCCGSTSNRNPFFKTMEDARGKGVDVFSPGYASDRGRVCDIPQWAEDSARSRYQLLRDEMDSPLGHDLETWERFQLDADGQGTTNAKKKLLRRTTCSKSTILAEFQLERNGAF